MISYPICLCACALHRYIMCCGKINVCNNLYTLDTQCSYDLVQDKQTVIQFRIFRAYMYDIYYISFYILFDNLDVCGSICPSALDWIVHWTLTQRSGVKFELFVMCRSVFQYIFPLTCNINL